MPKIFAIAWKDLKIRHSSKTQLLFFLVLPVIFTLLLSGMFFGAGSGKIVLVVSDQDNSALSHQLVSLLQASEVVAPSLMTPAEARSAFDNGDAAAILLIPSGMEARLKADQPEALDFNLDPTDNNGLAVQQEVQNAIGQVSAGLAVASLSTTQAEQLQPFADASERQAYYDRSLAAGEEQLASAPTRILVTQLENTRLAQNQKEATAAQASAGELIIWVFIPLLGTSELMAYERTWGTLRRIVTSPTRKPTFLLGMITGQFSYGYVQMLVLVLVGVVLLKVPWGQNPLALLALLLSFALAAVAMGTMLGTFTRTPSQANG
jgi:ABC-type Na+ efflux pump permease subunit